MWHKFQIGHGIGLRTKHFPHLLNHPPDGVDWFEIISENFFEDGGRPWAVLNKIKTKVPIVMHGVSMAIGNVDALNWDYLRLLKKTIERIEPVWVSDHICWGGFGGHYAHDLLPLPYTEETLQHLVPRIQTVQEFLNRQMVFENVSSYLTFRDNEMTEWEFVAALSKRSGCGLLLDVNNIYVSAYNHGFDVQDYLDGIPAESIAQCHIAGHSNQGDVIIDTHQGPTIKAVWDVYRMALKRFGRLPTLIEWDEAIPSFHEVVSEATLARNIEQEVLQNA